MSSNANDLIPTTGREFFGHPKGLPTLFMTEMWERFSFYGIRPLLILFMTATLMDGGFGFERPKAAAIVGIYSASVYLSSLPGGWIADRLLGLRRAIMYGAVLITSGHLSIGLSGFFGGKIMFFIGLILIVLGTGLLKPNISAIVGDLYPEGGERRDAGFSIFYMGINRWVHHKEWPVPGTRFTPFYLSSNGRANSARGDGTLGTNAASGAESDQFVYDPASPVPTLGGNDCCGAPIPAGPVDQRPLESRHDVLVYTSALLEKPVAIAGPVKMQLYAATDVPDTDFTVKLVDVHPNGFAMNIAEGILRARFRKGLDKAEMLKPGEVNRFEIDMRGTANVFQPGHHIRVDVTSSNFPQYDRNPNTGDPLGASDRTRVAHQKILHTPQYKSHIVLPVVEVPLQR